MDIRNLSERIRAERRILGHVGRALEVAAHAPLDKDTALDWFDRFRFLAESFHRHLERCFAMEAQAGHMGLVVEVRPNQDGRVRRLVRQRLELQRDWLDVLRVVHEIDSANLANLHALRQRSIGFLRRLRLQWKDEHLLVLDAILVDIGGEG